MSAEATRHAALHNAVDAAFETEQIPWLARLVDQPSHTLARRDVEMAATLIDALALELGMSVRPMPADDARFADHRIYSTAATTPSDTTGLLIGHVDTVFPRSSGFLKFSRDGDTLKGPGVVDMKSGLSIVFFALRALKETCPDTYATLPLRVAVVTDEELGSPSSAALYREMAPLTAWALDFEPGRTNDTIVTARKGTGTFTVTVTGVPAHSGTNHADGGNAIHADRT